jgi:hypothetical protein
MNAFTHPTESATNSPIEVTVTKRLTELSKSKIPVERMRQFDFLEFADETRLANVIVFEDMHSKLTATLGKDCNLVFVKRENFGEAKSEDGFDYLHYLVAIQTEERTYAVDLNFVSKAIAKLNKIVRNEHILVGVFVAIALLSLPSFRILVGFITLPISLMIILVGLKGLRERKLQLLTFEKILAVSSSKQLFFHWQLRLLLLLLVLSNRFPMTLLANTQTCQSQALSTPWIWQKMGKRSTVSLMPKAARRWFSRVSGRWQTAY